MPSEVKIFGITAIGDICLITEASFRPYLAKTMEILIGAGQVCLQQVDHSLPVEEQKPFHELRQSMLDAFISIINGIKLPSSDGVSQSQEEEQFTNQSILNMFHFLEAFVQLSDLSINEESGRLILDLYCDIMQHQMASNSTQIDDVFRRSNVDRLIEDKLGPVSNLIEQADGGEAIRRFQVVVQEFRSGVRT